MKLTRMRMTGAGTWPGQATAWLARRLGAGDRGDVPGWVLITIMTAGLVTVLWALAGDQLQVMFTEAMSSVTGPR